MNKDDNGTNQQIADKGNVNEEIEPYNLRAQTSQNWVFLTFYGLDIPH